MKISLPLFYLACFLFFASFSQAQINRIEGCIDENGAKKIAKFSIQDSLDIANLAMETTALRYVLDSIFPIDFDYERPLRFVIPEMIYFPSPPLLLCQLRSILLRQKELSGEISAPAAQSDSLLTFSNKDTPIPYYRISTASFQHPSAINISTSDVFRIRREKYYFIHKAIRRDAKKHPNAMYKILSDISNVREYQGKYYVRISFKDLIPYTYKIYDFKDNQAYTVLELPKIQETLHFLITMTIDSNGHIQVLKTTQAAIFAYDRYLFSPYAPIDKFPDYEYLAWGSYTLGTNKQKQITPYDLPEDIAAYLYSGSKLKERNSKFRFPKS